MAVASSNQLVQKLWNFCNVLRDDGVSTPVTPGHVEVALDRLRRLGWLQSGPQGLFA